MTSNSKQQRQEFMPAYDGRKAKIKGLWKRGDKYYDRLKIAFLGEDGPKVRRIPLKVTTRTVPDLGKGTGDRLSG